MTTHNSHHEQNDGDASVVTNSSAPETASTVHPAASETAEHTEETAAPEQEASSSSSEAVTDSVLSSEQTATEQPAESSASEQVSEVQPSENGTSDNESSHADESTEEGDVSSAAAFVSTPVDSQDDQDANQTHQEQDEAAAQTDTTENTVLIVETTEERHEESIPWNNEPVVTLDPVQAISTGSAFSTENNQVAENSAKDLSEQDAGTSATEEKAAEAEEIQPAPDVTEVVAEGTDDATEADAPEVAVVSSLIDVKAEEVRPFTDFIAEFRQAEAALRDTQVEALSILSSTEIEEVTQETLVNSVDVLAAQDEVVEGDALVASSEQNSGKSDAEEKSVADARSEKVEQEQSDNVEPKAAPRPVSPLLRPASRLRLPRHGVSRHLREEMQQPLPVDEQQGTATASKSEGNLEQTTTQNTQTSSDTPAEQPTPRPARRYRFDRPAASTTHSSSHIHSAAFTTGSSHHIQHNAAASQSAQSASQQKSEEKQGPAAAQAPIEETKQSAASQQNNGNGSAVNNTPTGAHQGSESQSKKHVNAQETENTAAQPVPEHGNGTSSKRRHSKEKEQQQAAATQAQESAPVNETLSAAQQNQAEQIAPEDLPPLEYSELQKASSRRRRRHRSSSSPAAQPTSTSMNGASITPPTPTPPVVPTPTPTQVPATPPSRSLPAASNQYSIVSGYTLHQMNQAESSSLAGPFMGPDPSPARGSVMVRDGRTTRAEARPTPPAYPAARSSDGAISTAAMTQFANVVSQALQQQTDRMVAEFRRMSQSPTNVSVSLPPFPSTERVGVFVDVANLLYSARTLRMTVHFGKLLDFLRGNRRLVRAHAYCPTSPQAGEEQMFLQAVKGLGYRITTKNYKTFSSGAKKADLDLDLCMDVVRLVDGNAVDCIVLVSGDSDFMPMLDYCSDHGVRVEVAAFDEAMSATLRQSCDLFINLSMLEEIRG